MAATAGASAPGLLTSPLNPSDNLPLAMRVADLTVSVLDLARSQDLIDRLTILRGYLELSLMFPENAGYVRRLAAALTQLSAALEHRGERRLAREARSISARFASSPRS